MAEPLTDEALAQMHARDEAAGDGWSVSDDLVWQDRHDLLNEVDRLRAVVKEQG